MASTPARISAADWLTDDSFRLSRISSRMIEPQRERFELREALGDT